MIRFLRALILGRIDFRLSQMYVGFGGDRVLYGAWDYYSLYLGRVVVMVSAPKTRNTDPYWRLK